MNEHPASASRDGWVAPRGPDGLRPAFEDSTKGSTARAVEFAGVAVQGGELGWSSGDRWASGAYAAGSGVELLEAVVLGVGPGEAGRSFRRCVRPSRVAGAGSRRLGRYRSAGWLTMPTTLAQPRRLNEATHFGLPQRNRWCTLGVTSPATVMVRCEHVFWVVAAPGASERSGPQPDAVGRAGSARRAACRRGPGTRSAPCRWHPARRRGERRTSLQ